MSSLRLPSPALVLATIAVFAACTGGAFAAGKITGGQIQNGSITGKDIKNDSLTAKDIKGQLRGPQGKQGAKGDRGPAGPAGTGSAGPAITYVTTQQAVPADDGASVVASCPAGQVAIGGGYSTLDTTDRTPTRSRPGLTPAGVRDRWEVTIPPAGAGQSGITVIVEAVCVKPGSVAGIVQAP